MIVCPCLTLALAIQEVEDQIKQKESDWQHMVEVAAEKDDQIAQYQDDLKRAHQRIDELETHKKMCAEEFRRAAALDYMRCTAKISLLSISSSPGLKLHHNMLG